MLQVAAMLENPPGLTADPGLSSGGDGGDPPPPTANAIQKMLQRCADISKIDWFKLRPDQHSTKPAAVDPAQDAFGINDAMRDGDAFFTTCFFQKMVETFLKNEPAKLSRAKFVDFLFC